MLHAVQLCLRYDAKFVLRCHRTSPASFALLCRQWQRLRKRLNNFSFFKKEAYTSCRWRRTWQPETHNKDCNCHDSHLFTLSSLLSPRPLSWCALRQPSPPQPRQPPPPPPPSSASRPDHQAAVPVERLMRGYNALHCAPSRLALPFTRDMFHNTGIFLRRLFLL